MKHLFIYLFLLASVFIIPTNANAAFVVKKQTASVQQTSKTMTATMSNGASLPETGSSVFCRMLTNGTIGFLSAVFGILGFFIPLFSLAAIVFGYIGIGRRRVVAGMGRHHNRGIAIVGFILGLIGLIACAIGGFVPIAVF